MLKKLLLSSIIALSLLSSAFADIVNINQADIATLAENLKGIGIKKAKAIVDYRKENGDFNSIDDITNVKGIGPKTLEKNRQSLSIEELKSKSDTDAKDEMQSSESKPKIITNKEEHKKIKQEIKEEKTIVVETTKAKKDDSKSNE